MSERVHFGDKSFLLMLMLEFCGGISVSFGGLPCVEEEGAVVLVLGVRCSLPGCGGWHYSDRHRMWATSWVQF